ncbi:MAG: 6-carboxytetrahydropterin synthase QueD [Spirochaetaceae bacterium]|jgi:6-pyruvoyltetrahydropterin/6-carboxytetrahydropterin synthase|nr:6-carboxytetrahydropterin synthase QueD [Spirochaetaceae bacterium]
MYTLRVEADFAAAHYLSHYHGKCEKLHGHNYLVRLLLQGKTLGEGGMLADFGLVRAALKDALVVLDHSNLNDFEVFANDPSAERIARYIYDELYARFPSRGLDPALLFAVDVFETPGSMARYTPDA